MDIGFVDDPHADVDARYRWSHILIPGELKSNPLDDKAPNAWLDLGRYAREVFAAQPSRRFFLGFTLCGSRMRLWEFDRLGGIASESFDINEAIRVRGTWVLVAEQRAAWIRPYYRHRR
ncbi:hypothetical protein K505DRAFT_365644 [Melanomma pulvis-pyrius CBS 109.77]|uniref:Fungal-type protein kinase domain-containing protein n=1 Tax=Melanomma pulvis-pyrius CBS 109.77 TaxID=1314802 RepID=A0A6A6WZQ5_9PLEO|nr:hypothetical protein K505DRAFT_365644 [Melanomma pulvis-pyrius CBS 109.77]